MRKLVDELRAALPPIAGVMHGAMVLEDAPFSEMSLETMNKVIGPKVLGTIHLDRLFRDDSLDFFLCFSSLASAIGNRGQANYSASNMYMVARAAERRRNGLAASILHLGTVIGVGYVTREAKGIMSSDSLYATVHRAGFDRIDVRALHQCIAEAILAGRPDSGSDPELITGVRLLHVDEEETASWMDIPRLQHCIARGSGTNTQDVKRAQGGAAVAVKTRLLEARTAEDALKVITDGFLQKLQVMLQIQIQSSDDRANILAANAEGTGIDSLVAVEIRSWFQKETGVDVPVLKILGGATITELINFAHEKLSADATPNIGREESNATRPSETETDSNAPVTAPPDEELQRVGRTGDDPSGQQQQHLR